MKLGYPNHPRRDLLSEITWIARNGFDFIDLFLEPDVCDSSRIDPRKVSEALKSTNLDVVGHTAWYLPIGSPMPQLRQAAVDIADTYFAVFAAVGCPKVTIHAHWPPSMFSTEEGLTFQIDSLQKITAAAKNRGIVILFEPVGMPQETRENLEHIFQAVPDLRFHLDIGHFNLNSRNPGDFAEAFAPLLAHVHLHDNDGSRDQHLPMGVGKIDWDQFIPRLKKVYDGTITLEVFSQDRDYVLLTKKKFLERWNSVLR
jgi:sugar phosphate isomerase/epimerase